MRRHRPAPSSPTAPTCTTVRSTSPIPSRYRVMLHVSFRHRDAGWGGYQAWPFRGFSFELSKFVQRATPRQLALLGVPGPGHPYWNEATLAGVQAPLSRARHGALARRAALRRGVSRRATASPAPPWARAGRVRPRGPGRGAAPHGGAPPAPAARPAGPSTRPAGMLIAGLPLRFDGAVSAALFMMARVKPISWMRSAPGMVEGGGPSAAERHVGMRRTEDEVRLVEEVRHGLVELRDGSARWRRPVRGCSAPAPPRPRPASRATARPARSG